MSVAVLNGRSPVFGGRLFFASLVGLGKCKQFTRRRGSVTRGVDISQRMKSHRWMMTGHLFSLVSGVVVIMTAVTRSMSSGSNGRKGK